MLAAHRFIPMVSVAGPLVDNFNRADSTTTINPASDGGTWTVDSGTWGISSDRGVLVATTAGQLWGGQCAIRRDLGSAAADLSVDVAHTAALNYVLMMLGVDPATGRAFWADLHQGIFPGDVDVRLVRVDAYGASVPLASTTIADWTGTKTFRVTHDGSGGLEVFADGVSILTASDPTWVVSLGTWVALSGQTTDSFDNFSASVV